MPHRRLAWVWMTQGDRELIAVSCMGHGCRSRCMGFGVDRGEVDRHWEPVVEEQRRGQTGLQEAMKALMMTRIEESLWNLLDRTVRHTQTPVQSKACPAYLAAVPSLPSDSQSDHAEHADKTKDAKAGQPLGERRKHACDDGGEIEVVPAIAPELAHGVHEQVDCGRAARSACTRDEHHRAHTSTEHAPSGPAPRALPHRLRFRV
eukprot:1745863-Rhodomonas_salina.2